MASPEDCPVNIVFGPRSPLRSSRPSRRPASPTPNAADAAPPRPSRSDRSVFQIRSPVRDPTSLARRRRRLGRPRTGAGRGAQRTVMTSGTPRRAGRAGALSTSASDLRRQLLPPALFRRERRDARGDLPGSVSERRRQPLHHAVRRDHRSGRVACEGALHGPVERVKFQQSYEEAAPAGGPDKAGRTRSPRRRRSMATGRTRSW